MVKRQKMKQTDEVLNIFSSFEMQSDEIVKAEVPQLKAREAVSKAKESVPVTEESEQTKEIAAEPVHVKESSEDASDFIPVCSGQEVLSAFFDPFSPFTQVIIASHCELGK